MSFCRNCGNEIKNGNAFCNKCGTPIKQNNHNAANMGKVIAGVILSLIIMITIIFSVNDGIKNYKSVINEFANSMTEADGKRICKTMFTDEMMKELDNRYFDQISSTVSYTNSMLEKMYDEDAEWKIKIKNKSKLDDYEIEQLENYYANHLYSQININEGYKLKIIYEVCGESDEITINIFRINGEGWKISEEIINLLLGFGNSNGF